MDWALCISDYVGNFDPLKLGQIRQITLVECPSCGDAHSSVELVILTNYWPNFLLDIRFSRVATLKIPDVESGGMIGFGELSVQNVSNFGLESIRYRLADNLTGFRCECHSIKILRLISIQDDGNMIEIESF